MVWVPTFGNEDVGGRLGIASPGKTWSPPTPSPLSSPLYAKFRGSLVVKCKTLHGEELESPDCIGLKGLLVWGSRLVRPFSATYDHLDLIGCL
ncbi:hypothetical protein PpBr36_03049 [Pyricularia pennisetigena]|uniref:hypothetical protein n=1 Tax=Pyricularia pennisetigena TaxID=1578925 RepID=UPI00114E2926|nr:hypothetical protein PpBr36_03049 [Pyricularia pennisetigena]TLS30914.1 hypothetical protein PpBr36_03049 [Pyricularia pennisetigena]